MKKTIIYLTSLLVVLTLMSNKKNSTNQTPDSPLSALLGTWIYTQGSETLKVKFYIKDYYVEIANKTVKMLYGNYCYSKTNDCQLGTSNLDGLFIHSFEFENSNTAITGFSDNETQRSGRIKLTLSNDRKSLSWELFGGGVRVALNGEKLPGYSIPLEKITLTKLDLGPTNISP